MGRNSSCVQSMDTIFNSEAVEAVGPVTQRSSGAGSQLEAAADSQGFQPYRAFSAGSKRAAAAPADAGWLPAPLLA